MMAEVRGPAERFSGRLLLVSALFLLRAGFLFIVAGWISLIASCLWS
jgi:hypothetical protein